MTKAPPTRRGLFSCGYGACGVISAVSSAATSSIAACNSSSDKSPHASYPGVASTVSDLSSSSALIHVRHSGDTLVDSDGSAVALAAGAALLPPSLSSRDCTTKMPVPTITAIKTAATPMMIAFV